VAELAVADGSRQPATAHAAEPLVAAEHLVRYFHDPSGTGVVRAVDDVSFDIRRGETFGLVGESGSGKSTVSRLLLGLDRPTSGRVTFAGTEISGLSPRRLRPLRRQMQMVFQDPHSSLNRRKTVAQIIGLPLSVHSGLSRSDRQRRVRELLDLVGLRPEFAERYPHEMSGGQCQRVGIARAIALEPQLVILDEAVSAVDVSIQAQILNLLRELQGRLGLTYLFVSHDLSVVRYMSNTIGVMYRGSLIERGSREQLFTSPRHPCTHALLASIPSPDPLERTRAKPRVIVREEVAPVTNVDACRYHLRCPLGTRELCRTVEPPLAPLALDHRAACHYPQSAESLAREAAGAPEAA